jgi:hypothetical protein
VRQCQERSQRPESDESTVPLPFNSSIVGLLFLFVQINGAGKVQFNMADQFSDQRFRSPHTKKALPLHQTLESATFARENSAATFGWRQSVRLL